MKSALLIAALLAVLVVPSSVVDEAAADPCINAPGADIPLQCDVDCRLEHEYGGCWITINGKTLAACLYTPDGC